ncbi:alkaline phosphatase family protein [Azospirillum sp. ST 5-10]|uniref:alkaline phosphatase family protein n=1 Tax=unclassified Azospirillum TaxID=2630922 RepID=UPI003F49E6EC
MDTPRRRNVLFVVADQWRGDALSAAGHPAVRTPAIDALAAAGTRFARHFANASPCGPSRACLLTGQYLHNHRSVRNGTPLDRRHTTLALEARRAGLAPALFGYTDTSADPRGLAAADPALRTYEGVAAGFDPVCLMTESAEPWGRHLRRRGYDVPARVPAVYAPPGDDPFGPALYSAADSDTAFLTDQALAWLEGQGERPWFAHVAYIRPHPPWIAPAPWHAAVDPAAVPPPRRAPGGWRDEAAVHPWLRWRLESLPVEGWLEGRPLDPRTLSEAGLARLRATYYGLIAEVDHHVGRLLRWLDDSGRAAETLVVVTADHGELLGDHWMFGKEGWFDPCFHVPLVVREPGRPGGRTVAAFTEHVDLMPTILDWLGVAPPRSCDGRSLRPWLAGDTPPGWRRHAHFALDFRDVAGQEPERALGLDSDRCGLMVLRGDATKYVHFAGLPPLFYDLAEDPGELRDRAADPARAAQVLEHAQALLSWRMAHDERTLTNVWLGPDGMVVRE